ncbi:MAG: lipoyl(octanoyl) transferase LipB [Myxococcota bacterium]|nr:lipoyl(octanoyl) transferase LipB [Myxococcota bacterium]
MNQRLEWLGQIEYGHAHQIMKERLSQRLTDEIPDTLLLCTHPPIYTVGRERTALNNLLNTENIPVQNIERGGNVTFHGPGQLVGYPILQIPEHKRDVHAFLRFIEEFWILFLQKKDVLATRDPRNTGVWVQGKKMVAIGIALRRWVSWHGFAWNIDIDLSYFQRINPCGMSSDLVTRFQDHSTMRFSPSDIYHEVGDDFFNAWKEWIG